MTGDPVGGAEMRVTVRRAAAGDAAALTGLRVREYGPDEAFARAYPGWIEAHRETHLPFVAEVDGAVVGMAWLLVAERVPAPGRPGRWFGDVQSVFVLPELRDRGIGAALMAAVLAEARARRMEHVTVHASDRAVDFYRRAGFGQDRTWLRWEPE